jgi:hypothetical protein
MNIFEQASRKALRFSTTRGQIATEELWSIPLQHKSGFDLDNIAKDHNAALKAVTDESFVVTADHPLKAELTLKMEIIKHIIAVKLEERKDALDAAAKAEKRQKLLAVLEKKQDEALEDLSPEEIQAQLAALS